jgi:hypothetical protein
MFATKKSFFFLMLLLCAPAIFCADKPRTFDPLKKIQLQLLEKVIQGELRKVKCTEFATERGYEPSELELTMYEWYKNRPY